MELYLERGRIVDGYVVRALLAATPQATSWRVDHPQRHTVHVLKVFHRTDPRRRSRLEQEVLLGQVVFHKNIVPCTQLVEVQGHTGLIMDYVDGPSLDAWLRDDPPEDLGTRLRVFRGLLDGVAHAHSRGIVHRGLKPSNVLIATEVAGGKMEFVVKIADFGLAKALSPEVGRFGGLTTVNTGLGTWGYAAPEQIRNASSVDHRADVYALGCLLYELVCGVPPFARLPQFEAFQAQRDGRYPSPRTLVPGLPETLYSLIDAMLAPDPANRPQSVAEVVARIESIAKEPVPGAKPPPPPARRHPAPSRPLVDPFEVAAVIVLCGIPLAAALFGAVVAFLT